MSARCAAEEDEALLGDVFGIGVVAEDSTAGGVDHGGVAFGEFLEGLGVVVCLPLLEEVLVGVGHG